MMRNSYIFAISLLVSACTSLGVAEDGMEYLTAGVPPVSKVEIDGNLKSAWEMGDQISVFIGGGGNECWSYCGEDKAATGTFSHFGHHEADAAKIAVYPFCQDASLDGGTIRMPFPSVKPALLGSGTDDKLTFSYLNAFVMVSFDNEAELKSLVLRGNDDEVLRGDCSIDTVKGELTMTSEGDRTVSMSGTDDRYLFVIPPTDFKKGLTITATYGNGETQLIRYTDPIQMHGGEVLNLKAFVRYSHSISIDFREKPFDNFPTNEANGMRTDNSYPVTIDGERYEFGFHAGYYEYPEGHAQAGTPEYGYRYYNCKYVTPNCNCLLIGRNGSCIKLPAIEGKAISKVSFIAGSTGISRYLSTDSEGKDAISEKLSSFTPGEAYELEVDYFRRVESQPLFLYFGNGNSMLLTLSVFYI